MVANPPFLGGQRITGAMGLAFREYLVSSIADDVKGSADLVTYFLLRMCGLAGSIGTLATNTISQGDTREVGLDRLTESGWTIQRAVKSEPWPNEANLEIAKLWLWPGGWQGAVTLNGTLAGNGIGASLEVASRVSGTPERLAANASKSFQGSNILGLGFTMSPEEAEALIERDLRNADVLFPYLNGKDLNDDPQQRPSRWVINFFDWSIERAQQYPDCFDIVEQLVKPDRAKVKRKARRERWWRYAEPAPNLYAAIANLDRVLAMTLVSKLALPAWTPGGQVYAHKLVIFPSTEESLLGLLTSSFHWWWTVTWSSTLGGVGNINYSPSDAFETFPQPMPQSGPLWDGIDAAGRELNKFRADLMIRTNLGLTKTYNRFHDPACTDADIVRLRELHVTLDHAVRDAYGWGDLELDHHHWETAQGMRFTVGEAAKNELLDRLLELNHERYAAEVAAGLHDTKTKKSAKNPRKKSNPNQDSLL